MKKKWVWNMGCIILLILHQQVPYEIRLFYNPMYYVLLEKWRIKLQTYIMHMLHQTTTKKVTSLYAQIAISLTYFIPPSRPFHTNQLIVILFDVKLVSTRRVINYACFGLNKFTCHYNILYYEGPIFDHIKAW